MQKQEIIGNSTTILNTIILMLVGIIFGKYGATLLHFGIDQTMLTEIITFIVFTSFAYVNAKYHNQFFKNDVLIETEETVLNDEYETETESEV